MALVHVNDPVTGNDTVVDEEWLTRWPDDFNYIAHLDEATYVPAVPEAFADATDDHTEPVIDGVGNTDRETVSHNVSQETASEPVPSAATRARPDLSETGSIDLSYFRNQTN